MLIARDIILLLSLCIVLNWCWIGRETIWSMTWPKLAAVSRFFHNIFRVYWSAITLEDHINYDSDPGYFAGFVVGALSAAFIFVLVILLLLSLVL